MNNKDSNDFWYIAALIITSIALFLFVFDGIGRITRFVYAEWPYVSVGGLIALICFIAYLFCEEVFRSQHLSEQEQNKKLEIFEIKLNSIKQLYESLEKRTLETSSRVSDHTLLCEHTIKKVDELLSQKGPVALKNNTNDSLIQDAATEIFGGR